MLGLEFCPWYRIAYIQELVWVLIKSNILEMINNLILPSMNFI